MSKRATRFLIFLILITSLVSATFTVPSVIVDTIVDGTENPPLLLQTASVTLSHVRALFDLIAEFTAYAIVLFCFCRYELKDALKSFIFAGLSFLFAIIFNVLATAAYNLFLNDISFLSFIINSINTFGKSLSVSFLTSILPCVLLAFIAYKLTNSKTMKITKFISFKEPILKTIAIFTLILYCINLVSALVNDIVYIANTIPEVTKSEFIKLMKSYIPNSIIAVYIPLHIHFLALLYCILFFVFHICKKYIDAEPNKKTKTDKTLISVASMEE